VTPTLERGAIDGIPVLRSEPVAGRAGAAMMFRVGRFDEKLTSLGVTHLVEHLALTGNHKAPYQFNAEVGGRFTTFFMQGSGSREIAEFLGAVCRGLTEDHSDLLEQEKRILRTEASSRGGAGALGRCLMERYGAAGPGLTAYEEFGLRTLTWADVAAWRNARFTGANAVVCIFGDVPDNVRLELPHGARAEPPELNPLRLSLPAYCMGGSGGIGMSSLARQSATSAVTTQVLQDRLTQILRHDRGLSYGVQLHAETLDAQTSHAWIAADALPEQIAAAGKAMISAIDSLALEGAHEDEISEYRRQLADALTGPAGPAMLLTRGAQNLLLDRAVNNADETLASAEGVSPQGTAEVARDLLGQAIMMIPSPIPEIQDRMQPVPAWSARMIRGKIYKSRRHRVLLTSDTSGVMLTMPDGRSAAVPADATAAMIRWNDGKRAVIGLDGFTVQIDPSQWTDGAAAAKTVDAAIDPSLIIEIDEPGPAWPALEAQPGTTTQAAVPAMRQRRAGVRVWNRIRITWLALAIGGAIGHGNPLTGLLILALGAAALGGYEAWLRWPRWSAAVSRRRTGQR
jgi:predicted Zn-dependent peptidase